MVMAMVMNMIAIMMRLSQYNYENVIFQLTDLHIGSIFKSSERELEKQYLFI